MITHLKGRLLAASAVFCIALPLTAAVAQNGYFNFNTTVDFADFCQYNGGRNVVAGCNRRMDLCAVTADIAEALTAPVALNVAGYRLDG